MAIRPLPAALACGVGSLFALLFVLAAALGPVFDLAASAALGAAIFFALVLLGPAALWPCIRPPPPPAAPAGPPPASATRSPSSSSLVADAGTGGGDGDGDGDDDDGLTVPPPSASAAAAAASGSGSGSGSRVAFLDRVKVLLTVLVVEHHVLLAFSSRFAWYLSFGVSPRETFFAASLAPALLVLNQTYFMCLFFFIAALFTPRSFARKGAYGFMRDRLLRLGIPLLAYGFVLGPFLAWLTSSGLVRQEFEPQPWIGFSAGPTWFLLWLLIFSGVYALFAAASGGGSSAPAQPAASEERDDITASASAAAAGPSVPPRSPSGPPRVWVFSLIGLGLGVIMLLMILAGTASGNNPGMMNFLQMPIVVGSFPFYVAFFCAGIHAAKHGWLERPLPTLSLYITVAVTITYSIFILFIYSAFPPSSTPLTSPPGMALAIAAVLIAGIATPNMAYAMTAIFQRLGRNGKPLGRVTAMASRGAYAAYILHPYFIVFFTWIYAKILEGFGVKNLFLRKGTPFSFYSTTPFSSDVGTDNALHFAGFFFVFILSLVFLFPVSYGLTKIPGLSRIL